MRWICGNLSTQHIIDVWRSFDKCSMIKDQAYYDLVTVSIIGVVLFALFLLLYLNLKYRKEDIEDE